MVRVAKIMVVLGVLAMCGSAWGSDPNLVAHWSFDEGSGTIAYDSAGDNNGTVYGAQWTTGQVNGALDFDGVDDYVDCGTGPAITGTGTFTASAWVKPDSGKGHSLLVQRSTTSGNGSYGVSILPDGRVQLHIYNGGYGFLFKTDVTVNDGLWHHIVVVRTNSTDGEIYVDGSLAASGSGPARSLNNVPVWIGRAFTVPAYFGGSIDEVRIYNRALSAEEIQQLYQNGVGELIGLEITGPEEVAENFQMQYAAIAYYDNNSTRDVTDSAQWLVGPNAIASIDSNGLLTTEEIYILEEDITICAQYTEDTNTFEAEKAVSVFAICPTGTALSFDGVNDYVDFSTGPAITGTGTFTASAWVKTDSARGKALLTQRSTTSGNGSYGVSILPDGRVQLHIYNGGYGFLFKTDVTVNDGLWHHIVVVRTNSTDGEIYVDGGLAASGSGPARSLNNVPVWIGRAFTVPAYFDGLIDDVCIYNRALSAEEIQANMHMKLTGDEPNLVGYWGFDEGEGQVAYDLSGNSNNGYLGSDPCDVDSADPAWVESDAPIGICTTGGLIERNVTRALESKQRALEEIEAALANENATIGVLEALFRSRDYSSLDKNDIVKAKQEIHSAVQNEQRSTDTLEKSIEKLEDSLSVLGYEVGPNGSNN